MTLLGVAATAAASLLALLIAVPAAQGRRPGEELLIAAPSLGLAGWLMAGGSASGVWVPWFYLGLFAVAAIAAVVHARLMWPSYWLAPLLALATSLAGIALVGATQ